MASIKVTKIAMTSAKLAAMKQAHRNWLFFLGHVSNELMMLNKWVLWSDPHLPVDDVRQKASAAQVGFLLRLLLGKQLEAGDVLMKSYFGNPIRTEIDARMEAGAIEAERRLEDYFERRKDTIHYWVRNNFSFHYSIKDIGSMIAPTKKAEEMAAYMGEQSGNVLYEMSEAVVNRAMLKGIDTDTRRAIELAVGTAVEVNGWLFAFIDGFALAVLGRPFKDFDLEKHS